MKVGDKEVAVGPIDGETTVRLIKFINRVYKEMDEDSREAEIAGLLRSGLGSLLNILSPLHLYELTAILLGMDKKEVGEIWTLNLFSDLIAEVSESNDLEGMIKNLSRVVAALRS